MKYIVFLLILVSIHSYAQDTTVTAQYPDGNKMLLICFQGDSVYQYINSNGNVYMEKHYEYSGFNGTCIGWHNNGKLKFVKYLEKGEIIDTARYYNEKGKLVATVHFRDSIEELYQRTDQVVFSGITYSSSVVHGGMELPGGGSNDSRSEGPMRFRSFVILQTNKKYNEEEVIREFTTDFDGNYCEVLSPGKYRILPKDFYERQLKDPSLMLNQGTKGWWSTWSGNSIDLTEGGVYDHVISYSFVGVAP